jgi:hypothetical protein
VLDSLDRSRVVEWMLPRWETCAAWTPEEWDAFWQDLQAWSAGAILSALARLWRAGMLKPPKSGVVLRMLDDLAVKPDTGPEPVKPEPGLAWAEHAAIRYGAAHISILDAALIEEKREHKPAPQPAAGLEEGE